MLADLSPVPAPPKFIRSAPVIGSGVHVGPSQIPEHGLGLFATSSFAKHSILTFYDGFVLDRQVLWSETVGYQPTSHTLSLFGSEFVVQGLQHAIEGMGGGSFANHRPPPVANCIYFCVPPHQHAVEYTLPALGLEQPLPMCFIKALRSIRPGDELFCNYGRETCEIIGVPYDHPSYHTPKQKSKQGCQQDFYFTTIVCLCCGLALTSGSKRAELPQNPSQLSVGAVQRPIEREAGQQLEVHAQVARAPIRLPGFPEGHAECPQLTRCDQQVGMPDQMNSAPLAPSPRAQAHKPSAPQSQDARLD